MIQQKKQNVFPQDDAEAEMLPMLPWPKVIKFWLVLKWLKYDVDKKKNEVVFDT